ncbi:NAD(P)/FAD-dependent oxidoreductase [Anaeromyxobacter oryzae]|uniref:FAD-dependent oxidoreductase n=1 Tax=Anaeromyxobacter oryzae TaxID=2918170 RepID=A0ABN6MSR8_9BACT|nr:NAD(P)/FAD-dependent oxidoreductase [Anaeromyxobacter oryzae]BDG02932.1 FAD-dependent oxidoreductase [Anaeromyxobacter oryzae]
MSRSISLDRDYDVLVVGARPAGAATTMLLARAGLRVLAVDREREGSDTLSTHALMRAGVLQLRRWGVLGAVEAAGTPAVRAATFHYGAESIAVLVKPRDGVDALYAPRRTTLDPLLVSAAREAGAHVAHEVVLTDVARGRGGRVEGATLALPDGRRHPVSVGLIVGADGRRSRVARAVGAPVERSGRHASAVVYGYWSGLPVDGYHWYYEDGVSAGALPTDGGRTCLFVAVPARRFAEALGGGVGVDALYERALAVAAPSLARALGGARLDGKLRPFAGERGFLRRSWGPGWALVGDAGYYKDPITAHGITDALRDAELLARAVARGTDGALAEYQGVRDEVSRQLFEVTDTIASFAWTLEEVKGHHRELARNMAAEVELVAGLDGPATAVAVATPATAPSEVPAAARAYSATPFS